MSERDDKIELLELLCSDLRQSVLYFSEKAIIEFDESHMLHYSARANIERFGNENEGIEQLAKRLYVGGKR